MTEANKELTMVKVKYAEYEDILIDKKNEKLN